MVSAWSTANGVVLGQVATSEHSNEITAIPRLLELLELKNCLVTIDAIGCQTEIVDAIVARGGDYLISVKDNQPKLNAAVSRRSTRPSPRSVGRRARTRRARSRVTVEPTSDVAGF